MPTLITINLVNKSTQSHGFYFFQEPAKYTGGTKVYSNSLFGAPLSPYDDPTSGGGSLTFRSNLQFVAGVQQSDNNVPPVGQASGYGTATRPIDLTTSDGSPTNNSTLLAISDTSGLGLSAPKFTPGVQAGAFRITTPSYNAGANNYLAGSAVQLANGSYVLSNFVLASPAANIDAQPILKYYVAVGDFVSGTVMNFTTSSVTAALCDATSGKVSFNVTYDASGKWQIS
ncbi:hypothetical protein [Acidisoma silvae]|uniref:Uncharacterized protein n=1 Tax=Acidisoma silvae TaxID=2802396 RepID=A0A963YUG8_9PROT|nr:hypothetical protein [Acidisoma silvae]MCB8877219.1 hypothetical protein [Acidisoma silvae]